MGLRQRPRPPGSGRGRDPVLPGLPVLWKCDRPTSVVEEARGPARVGARRSAVRVNRQAETVLTRIDDAPGDHTASTQLVSNENLAP